MAERKTQATAAGPRRSALTVTPASLFANQLVLLVVVLAVTVVIFSVLSPNFLTFNNFGSVLQDATETATLAVAETFVIVTGGIDISVGAILGLAGVVGAQVIVSLGGSGLPAPLAFAGGCVAALAVGLVCGGANGLMITRARVTPFVATLAMLGIATGITYVLTNGVDISGVPGYVASWGNNTFVGILTVPIVVTALLVIVGGLFLHRSQFGRWTFAIGSNRRGARSVGIRVGRHLTTVYILSGLISALAGILVFMRLGTGSPLEGANDELNAIAAVVIGGASLFGGVGTIGGSLLGSLIIAIIVNGLIIVGIQPYWQQVIIGLIIAAAVMFQQRGHRDAEDA